MGTELFARFPDWTATADAVLGYSIRELCEEDPRGVLGSTAFTQPALFVVNALSYRARIEEGRPVPSFVAGHSLGEYNALVAAGVFDFESGLRMVRERGRLMGEVGGGGMMAVIGLAPSRIEAVLADSEAGRRVDVANFNSPEQTVLAGLKDDLTAVEPSIKAAGARACIVLKVSAAFHSRYMHEPMHRFKAFLGDFAFGPPSIPVVANLTGLPYPPDGLHETLASQIGHSVRWLDSVRFLLDQGVTDFEEIGPGTVLTKLIAQVRKTPGRSM
jgi:malonyl CoA-acyl carrier protein transacylase